MEYIKIRITETGRQSLKSDAQTFGIITEVFQTIYDARQYLTDRYSKMPAGQGKIYRDNENGKAKEVGFTHSYWNNDISHNSKKWYQTDWIELLKIKEDPILL